ncbi:hypothetical protein ACFVTC_40400 [Streptomyces sp. NPDC057950]|uniref:hypothetical protein n=1 Tax=Streptomyces sp. NPDC057950 TaxID=3346288 RepID=UPI0036E8AE3F
MATFSWLPASEHSRLTAASPQCSSHAAQAAASACPPSMGAVGTTEDIPEGGITMCCSPAMGWCVIPAAGMARVKNECSAICSTDSNTDPNTRELRLPDNGAISAEARTVPNTSTRHDGDVPVASM